MTIKEIVFGDFEPQQKLVLISSLTNYNVLTNEEIFDVMKKIMAECADEYGYFGISGNRRVGNHWNSWINGLRLHDEKVFVDVYIQNDSTDTNTSETYYDMLFGLRDSVVGSYCGRATYSPKYKAEAVRSILSEYVYYKYIEDEERARACKRVELRKVVEADICNHYFKYWRLDTLPFSYMQTTKGGKVFYECKDALSKYIDEHIDELYGKPAIEQFDICKKVWQEKAEELGM